MTTISDTTSGSYEDFSIILYPFGICATMVEPVSIPYDEYMFFGTPPWRECQINEQIETKQNWKLTPIKKPLYYPRPEINRRMMWCDRRD